ncbi:MAG: hypothetical protein PHY82_07030 [Lentisphaeria bacterium]|nr:hypothetical protein [Lentisphaeria bacterium]
MNWSKTEIRQARKLPLAPLLLQRGLTLRELSGENFLVLNYGDLTIRQSFWIWKSRQLQGNTIDFFIQVENLSFAQTMTELLGQKKQKTSSEI